MEAVWKVRKVFGPCPIPPWPGRSSAASRRCRSGSRPPTPTRSRSRSVSRVARGGQARLLSRSVWPRGHEIAREADAARLRTRFELRRSGRGGSRRGPWSTPWGSSGMHRASAGSTHWRRSQRTRPTFSSASKAGPRLGSLRGWSGYRSVSKTPMTSGPTSPRRSPALRFLTPWLDMELSLSRYRNFVRILSGRVRALTPTDFLARLRLEHGPCRFFRIVFVTQGADRVLEPPF